MIEHCNNCGRVIGGMEIHCAFKGFAVCFDCDKRLRQQSAGYETPPYQAPPPPSRQSVDAVTNQVAGKIIRWLIIFGLLITLLRVFIISRQYNP